MSRPLPPLSDRDLLRYLQCPHWPYWEIYEDAKFKQIGMEPRERLMQGRLLREAEIARKVYGRLSKVEEGNDEEQAKRTFELMQQGAQTIYGGCLLHDGIVAHPTLLVRKDQPSLLGKWSYIPVLVKRRHVLRKEDHLHVGWQAHLLEKVQGLLPSEGFVLGPDANLLPSDPRESEAEVLEVIQELERIREGECPEPTLRKACLDTSPWGTYCLELAERTRDIALIFQVNRRQRAALRQVGILSVEQAAAMDPVQLSGSDPRLTLKALQSIQRQARSIEDDTVIVRAPFKAMDAPYEIHFDIESYPPTDTDYLFGCLVRDRRRGTDIYTSFVAKRLGDEKRLWMNFLRWTKTLPEDYVVYHYSLYEQERLDVLARRYETEDHEGLQRFRAAMIDLNELTKDHAVFPLYIYSLKNVGALVGATWKGEVSHGADSVGAYQDWLENKKPKTLEALLRYNEEDVRATAALLDWLNDYAKTETIYHRPFPWEKSIR